MRRKYSTEDLLKYGKNNSDKRKRLIGDGLKERRCERCGSTEKLELHHKNFNKYDNNLDNLIILCENCHDAAHEINGVVKFCRSGKEGRKKEDHGNCPICGKPLNEGRKKYCSKECADIGKSKEVPSKEQLQKDLEELGSKRKIAEKYGVSHTLVRKWFKE